VKRTTKIAVIGASALVGAVALGVVAKHALRSKSIVDVLPKNTGVILDVDLDALRRSGRGREAIDGLNGLAQKASPCATSVLASIERVAVAVPVGAAYENDFAIVGFGPKLHAKDVIDCAQSIVRARGGEPHVVPMGSFSSVQEGEGGAIAVRDGGPLVVGSGPWLGAIVDVADGVAPSLHDDPIHHLARASQKGAVATLTYALPPDVRELLAQKLPDAAKPIAHVPAIVAAVRIDESSGALTFDADATCEESTCAALKPLVENARDVLSHDPRATIAGVRGEIEAASVVVDGGHLRVALRVPFAKIDAIVQQLASPSGASIALPSGHPDLSPSNSASPSASTSASVAPSTSASASSSP
jgi:hypothetical protein